MKRLSLGLAVLTVLLLGSASVAQAQYYGRPRQQYGYPPPPPPPPAYNMYRSGLVIGAGLGFGGISADQCGDICGFAGAFEFHLGGMLNPRLALEGDVWVNWHGIADSTYSTRHTLYTIALQYWATEMLWLKGGVGGANMNISSDLEGLQYGDENGPGLIVAGGYEFVQAGFFALDAQLRFGHGFYSEGGDVNSWALMLGANWF